MTRQSDWRPIRSSAHGGERGRMFLTDQRRMDRSLDAQVVRNDMCMKILLYNEIKPWKNLSKDSQELLNNAY